MFSLFVCLFVFFLTHLRNVRILIGQRPAIQNHKVLLTFIFNKADKSRYHFEIILEETLRSLEENGIKFVLKAKQKKAIEQFYEKNNLLAILPTGYGKSLIYQLVVLLAKRAGNYALNLTAWYLPQKLACLEDRGQT